MTAMLTESVEDLKQLAASGAAIKYLAFWGHTPRRDGGIDAACLSQWWPGEFRLDGHRFGSAEHYMMWRKACLFDDAHVADEVLAASHPRQAKQLGREVRGFDPDVWQRHRFDIVVDCNRAKFVQDDRLRDFLVGTRKRVLVEASPVDREWGIGLPRDHPHVTQPAKWRGLNLLGFALMRVRHELVSEA